MTVAPIMITFRMVHIVTSSTLRRAKTRNLLRDSWATDHLDVGNEKRLRTQGEQSAFQRVE